VQAGNFDNGAAGVAYRDTTTGNSGGAYRATDVDLEASTDTGGGYNVGWVSPGEWLTYAVNVASAGTYTIEVRVASPGAGGTFTSRRTAWTRPGQPPAAGRCGER